MVSRLFHYCEQASIAAVGVSSLLDVRSIVGMIRQLVAGIKKTVM